MSDLISRSALYEKMTEEYKKHYAGTGTGYDFTIAMNMVQQQPTIEAVPVVHGEWIQRIDAPDTWDCSNCGADICLEDDLQTPHDVGLDFCPKCGAMMKGGAE